MVYKYRLCSGASIMFIIQIGGKTLWYHSVMEFATVDDAYLPNSFLFGQVRSLPVMQLELFKSRV
jgi:hypothetical protein